MACKFVALLFHISKRLGKRFIETLIWTNVLHTQCLGNSIQALELYDAAVCTHFLYLLAILDINVSWAVLLIVLNCEALAGRWALATKALHLGTNLVHA